MKKTIGIILSLILVVVPITSSFADEINNLEKESVSSDLIFTPNEKFSVTGSGGTAEINYGSAAKNINWRVTSTKGTILMFSGMIEIFRSSDNKLMMVYPVSGGGRTTLTGQVSVSHLKKGHYWARFTGSGRCSKGGLAIKSGLTQSFQKY